MTREIKFRAWDGEAMWDVREIEWDAGGIASLYLGLHSQEMNDTIKVMQFTGLKDKNGKEIYEGDVVRYGDEDMSVVEWANHMACFQICDRELCKDAPMPQRECEVIGNIYENPELLAPIKE